MPTAADAVVISWETVPGVYNPDTAVCNFALDVGLVGFQVIAEAVNESAGTTRSYVVDHWRGRFTAPLDLGAAPHLEVSPAGQHPCGFGRAAVPSKLVMMPFIRQIGRQPPRP